MPIKFSAKDISQIRKGKYRPATTTTTPPPPVSRSGDAPLNSETGCPGELWSNTNLLNWKNYCTTVQYCVLCTVYCVLCTAYCVLCNVYCVLCIVYCVLYTVYCVQCTVYSLLCTVYCLMCTVYCILCTVYCVLCTVYCGKCCNASKLALTRVEYVFGIFFFFIHNKYYCNKALIFAA